MSDNELGRYLRARREAVRPSELGLPEGSRRRTPGLRRSELATVAGVSVEYLTRLEQGRDRNPSLQVLGTLADALRLPPAERAHLRMLAKTASGGDALLCPSAWPPPSRAVRPTVRALLDRLEPAPAVVLNRLGEVLAHTGGFRLLAAPIGLLDGEPPNLVRYLFTDARARAAFPGWSRLADEHAAELRLDAALADPHTRHLVDELTFTAGPAFTERMAAAGGEMRTSGTETLVHPEAGELRLARETMQLDDGEQRLLVYLPADAATTAALDRLTGRRPGALRAVND
ncbi:helix-turn-helix domain-containing protein [Nonomuraea sp. NN258]|uniref:helix-turn-helix domain-containing protein n=1 Tax=Nonomuraea antri TaxID=2730852 RepID=UPI00156A4434|nr:helix-turn-helix domain-containing protein [Nonomuraea antri]NRQ36266.1 helix-turn-helix domain-containing protein [Nonomuraea antri]